MPSVADCSARLAGVYLGEHCLLVLTRTVRAALDGLLLGWDLGGVEIIKVEAARNRFLSLD